MTTVTSIDYIAENTELQPSMFRYSENFNLLIECIFKPYVDQQEDFLWLKDNILSIDDAELWHLDFLGALIGQSRLLVSFNTEPYFGFENSYQSDTLGTVTDPDVGGYWKSASEQSSKFKIMDDETYRTVLRARIKSNTSGGTINDFLEVVNILTGTRNARIDINSSGDALLVIPDKNLDLLQYFFTRIGTEDSILPIPLGVNLRVELI